MRRQIKTVPLEGSSEKPAPAKGGGERSIIERPRWCARVLVASCDRFYRDNGFSRAASMAYTTLLSLLPLTALIFGLFASLAVSRGYVQQVREFIFRQFVPNTPMVERLLEYLEEFSAVLGDSSVSLLVIASLVVTSILLINSIEAALNEVWQVYEARSITDRLAIFSAILLIGPVFVISGYYFVKLRIEPLLIGLGSASVAVRAYSLLVPILIDFLAFSSLYYLVPKAPVRLRAAVFGGIFSALMFGLAKGGFAVYVERFASYDQLYGALAAVPIFLLWLYLAWTIILLGAEVSYQAQHLPPSGRGWRRTVMNVGDGQLLLATQSLVMVSRAFVRGEPLPNDLEIAESLGCSSVVLKPILSSLQRAGLIARGSSREMPITLLRSPESIAIGEVAEALFAGRREVQYPAELSRTFGAFAQRELRTRSLRDVVEEGENSASGGVRSIER